MHKSRIYVLSYKKEHEYRHKCVPNLCLSAHALAIYTYTHILTKAKDGVVLHQCPGVVVQTVALVDQELTDVSGRHVCWDLHHFTGPILTPHLHYLKTHGDSNDNIFITAANIMFSQAGESLITVRRYNTS